MATKVEGAQNKVADRRRAPRVKLSQTVRIQSADAEFSEEICQTSNVSRTGLYFETWSAYYCEGQSLLVTRNYRADDLANRQEQATVVRVDKFANGRFGVAVHVDTL